MRRIIHQMSLRLALIERLRHLRVIGRQYIGISDYWDAVDEGRASMIVSADHRNDTLFLGIRCL